MTIEFWQAALIGVFYYLSQTGSLFFGCIGSLSILYKPLVAGTIVGFILGDPVSGCIIGAAIQLPYIAFISAGGSQPMDPGLAGYVGTAWAMVAGVSPAAAVTIALPLGLLGTMIWIAHMTLDVTFVHMADKAAEKGDLDKICFLHVWPPQILLFFLSVIPATIAVYYGADAVADIIASLSSTPLHVLEVIGGLLPALGIAMNLRAIGRTGTIPFFILGFIFIIYFKLPITAVAVIAAIIAFFYTQLSHPAEEALANAGDSTEEEDF